MRAFIAITLPAEIKEKLCCRRRTLCNTGADVKWVAPENIHLTLKFLGEINQEQLERILAILQEAADRYPPYEIKLANIGAFPEISRPRVIWAGLCRGEKETKEIAKYLEEKIQKLGIPKEERAFQSHITLGRMRSGENIKKLSTALRELELAPEQEHLGFSVEKITLFKSTLSPGGPIYEIIKEASLKAA